MIESSKSIQTSGEGSDCGNVSVDGENLTANALHMMDIFSIGLL